MKSKILSIMEATKKKAAVALLCGALITTAGAGAALAANPDTSMLYKIQGGIASYSTDDGKTWGEKAPDGVTVSESEDSKFTVFNGLPTLSPKDAEGKSLLCKVENGVRSFSTDGGKTWSEKAPDGVTVSESEDSKFTVFNGLPTLSPKDAEGKSLLCKVENGVRSFSTDGGKTWSEEVPEGATVTEGGKVRMMKVVTSENAN